MCAFFATGLFIFECREKLESSEERRRRAERAKSDVQRALRAAVDTNG